MFDQDKIIGNNQTHIEIGCADGIEETHHALNIGDNGNPDEPLNQYNLAQSFLKRGQFQDACLAFQQVISMEPKHASALCSLAGVYIRLGNYDKAIACYDQSIRFNPENYRTHRSLGDTYQSIGCPDKAAQSYAAALKLRPEDPYIIASLALALTRLGKKEQALIFYQKAISCRPDDYTLHNQYATVLEKCNRLAEARQAIAHSLSAQPNNYGAAVNLATVEYREGNYDEAYRLLNQLDLNGRTYEAVATIKQQEGLALDKLGRYPEAFECFQQSNYFTMKTSAYRYLQPAYEVDRRQIKTMAVNFSSEIFSSWEQPDYEVYQNPPVFLVGFPRSGTTLMEQILNAHSQIVTLDERSPLQNIVDDFKADGLIPNRLNDISFKDINEYRNDYFRLLRKRTNTFDKNALIIDKLPLNILNLPLVYRIFPDAKVIVALRHPLDCILSNFIQRFKLNKKMMHFLTLRNSALFYDIAMGLYLKYRESIPLPIHEIKYERLTENFEEETKSLAAFLGIAWSPSMMQYHRKAANRVINTPSYTEVIKPIHRKAVYRWKNYRQQLSPILPVVQNYIDRFGYSLES